MKKRCQIRVRPLRANQRGQASYRRKVEEKVSGTFFVEGKVSGTFFGRLGRMPVALLGC